MANFVKIIIVIALFMLVAFTETIPAAATEELPATLPNVPSDSLTSELGTTPEYVIIRPSDQATFSSETSGGVAEVLVKEGSNFLKGDTLLILDCRLQKAELKKAVAEQSATSVAQKSAYKLKKYGAISEFEYIKANAEAVRADAEVDKLNAIVDKCVINAPFSGSVAEIMVHAHESVKPGDPLLKIVNTENLEFEMHIPSCWLNHLHVGSSFSVYINETKAVIPAKITKINPEIESVSQSVRVIATITPAQKNLLPGMSGQAIFDEKFEKMCPQGKK